MTTGQTVLDQFVRLYLDDGTFRQQFHKELLPDLQALAEKTKEVEEAVRKLRSTETLQKQASERLANTLKWIKNLIPPAAPSGASSPGDRPCGP